MKKLLFLFTTLLSFSAFSSQIICKGHQTDLDVTITLSEEHFMLSQFNYQMGNKIIPYQFQETHIDINRHNGTHTFRQEFRVLDHIEGIKFGTLLRFMITQDKQSADLFSFTLNPSHRARLVKVAKENEILIDNLKCD